MTERLVTIFGGSGFVGRHLVNKLTKAGWRIRVAVRDPEGAKFLKPLGDLGQVSPVYANITREDTVRSAVQGASAVINLVGILYEKGPVSFDAIHVVGAETIARLAREAGVQHLVHMSALGADPSSPASYARSKAEGETRVKTAFPGASILRPSVIFGPEDDFYNRFGAMARALPFLLYFTTDAPALRKAPGELPRLDLVGSGGPKLQPVYVGDVAEVICRILDDRSQQGKLWELGGPRVMTLKEIMEQVMRETRRGKPVLPAPMAVARIQAALLQFLPVPPLTPDMVKMMERDSVVSGTCPGLAELGIRPETTEAIIPSYLERFRPTHRQIRRIGRQTL